MKYLKLSKTMSYALRHAPDEFNIKLNNNGWTNLNLFLEALRSHHKTFKDITLEDILDVVKNDEKGRYEVSNGNIRAVYGHSTKDKILKKSTKPPKYLYHGTTSNFSKIILTEGLKPKQRQYVHLSQDIETATNVGLRRTNNPVILQVNSQEAFNNGVKFYKETNGIWLADYIPAKYLI